MTTRPGRCSAWCTSCAAACTRATAISQLHAPTLRALAYAKATRPSDLIALTVAVDEGTDRQLQADWDARQVDVPLTIVSSPYREVTRPVLDYIRRIRRDSPRDVVTVFIPEYVVGHWWEHLLHNQSALRLKGRLLYEPGVMVTSVPYQLNSSHDNPINETNETTELHEDDAPQLPIGGR
jgi:hypothetical protein